MSRLTNALLYQLKRFQFRLVTWRNRLQIRKAYGPLIPSRFITYLAGIAGALVLVAALVLGISHIPFRSIRDSFDRAVSNAPPPEDLVVDTVRTAATPPPPPQESPLPANTPSPDLWQPPSGLKHLLLANKATDTLTLFARQKDDLVEQMSFFMASGINRGRKKVEGDRRTPEGVYFIVGKKEASDLNAIYGPHAWVLNYPNDEDRKAGRTGKGIWIHGTAPDSTPIATRGCIEIHNGDNEQLYEQIGSGIGTPVIIAADPDRNDPLAGLSLASLTRRRAEVLGDRSAVERRFAALLTRWKTAWENMDIDRYETFYDTSRFFGQGLDWPGWRERKLYTFDKYDTIAVSLESIFVSDYAESTAVVKFIQTYSSNLATWVNGKKLTFIHTEGSWKILRESSFPKEELLL